MTATSRSLHTFCWSELATTDAAAARAFYLPLLGWEPEDQDLGPEMGVYTKLKVAGAEGEFGAMYQMNGPMFEGVPSHWLAYILVEDVAATAEKAKSLGGEIVVPPMDVQDHGRMAVLKEPSGATFAVWQALSHVGAPVMAPTHGVPCWYELASADVGKSGAFLTALFGWTQKSKNAGTDAAYHEFFADEECVGGMLQMDERWQGAPAHYMTYFTVDDCDASVAQATALGGAVHVPPSDIPTVGRFSIVADPTGAMCALIKLSMECHED